MPDRGDGFALCCLAESVVTFTEQGRIEEELAYLEEPYVPHPLAGVMAQNKPESAKQKHVWSTGDQKV